MTKFACWFTLLAALVGMLSVPVGMLSVPAGAAATQPTQVEDAQVSSWTTTDASKTATVSGLRSGDVLVAYGLTETQSGSITISGGGLTWTQRQHVNASSYARAYAWTATASASGNLTVTFTAGGTSGKAYGGGVVAYRNSGGIGASAKTNVSSGAPSLSLTTTQADSAVVVASADWNAVDGASRTWRTGAGTATELTYARNSCCYTAYAARHVNAGSAGAKTVGLSAPSGQKYSIVAVEVKGTTAPPTTQCNDGVDNVDPEDILIDMADPGCSSSSDDDETDPTQCNDGVDNLDPEDTLVDLADPGCNSSTDNDETDPTQCNDGVDNSDPEDTLVDLADPGCANSADNDETDPSAPTDCFADPSGCGYPDADNTGPTGTLQNATTTTLPSGVTWDATNEVLRIEQDNVTVQNLDIPGSVAVDGDNVTISNSRVVLSSGCGSPCGNYGIRLGRSGAAVSGTTLDHVAIVTDEANPANDDPLDSSTIDVKVEHGVRNNGDMSSEAAGLYIKGPGGAWKGPGTITDSFLFSQLVFSGDHVETYLNGGEGNPTVLDHNTMLNPVAQTAVVSLFDDFGTIGSVTVTDNLMAGGGYIMYGGAKNSASNVLGPVLVQGNRISNGYYANGGSFGLFAEFNASVTTSCDNYWDDDLLAITGPGSSC